MRKKLLLFFEIIHNFFDYLFNAFSNILMKDSSEIKIFPQKEGVSKIMTQRNSRQIFLQKQIEQLINHKFECADGSCPCQLKQKRRAVRSLHHTPKKLNRYFLSPQDIFSPQRVIAPKQKSPALFPSPQPTIRIFTTIEQSKSNQKMEMNELQWIEYTKATQQELLNNHKLEKKVEKMSEDTFKRQAQFYLMKLERNYENCTIAMKVLDKIARKKKEKTVALPKIIQYRKKRVTSQMDENRQARTKWKFPKRYKSPRQKEMKGLIKLNKSLIEDCQIALQNKPNNLLEGAE